MKYTHAIIHASVIIFITVFGFNAEAQSLKQDINKFLEQATESNPIAQSRLMTIKRNLAKNPETQSHVKAIKSFYLYDYGRPDLAAQIKKNSGDKELEKAIEMANGNLKDLKEKDLLNLANTFYDQADYLGKVRSGPSYLWARALYEIYLMRYADHNGTTLSVMLKSDIADEAMKANGFWPVWQQVDPSIAPTVRAWRQKEKQPEPKLVVNETVEEEPKVTTQRVRATMNKDKNAWNLDMGSQRPDERSKKKANWNKIKTGMSTLDVYKVLGAPNARNSEFWEYGHNPNIFSSKPADESGVIYFKNGKVSQIKLPKKL